MRAYPFKIHHGYIIKIFIHINLTTAYVNNPAKTGGIDGAIKTQAFPRAEEYVGHASKTPSPNIFF